LKAHQVKREEIFDFVEFFKEILSEEALTVTKNCSSELKSNSCGCTKDLGIVQCTTSHNENKPLHTVNLRKRERIAIIPVFTLKFPNGHATSKAKYDDLISLLPFISDDFCSL